MLAKFCDGPLDGVEIECPKTIDKVLIVDDDGIVTRYECDVVEFLADYAAGEMAPDCLLHLAPLHEDFDEELLEVLRPAKYPRPSLKR